MEINWGKCIVSLQFNANVVFSVSFWFCWKWPSKSCFPFEVCLCPKGVNNLVVLLCLKHAYWGKRKQWISLFAFKWVSYTSMYSKIILQAYQVIPWECKLYHMHTCYSVRILQYFWLLIVKQHLHDSLIYIVSWIVYHITITFVVVTSHWMKINLQDFLSLSHFTHKSWPWLAHVGYFRMLNMFIYDVRMTAGIQSANPIDSAVVRAGIYHPLTHYDGTRKAWNWK